MSDIRHLSETVAKLKEEVTDYKDRYESIIEFAHNNGIEVPVELQTFVDIQHLL